MSGPTDSLKCYIAKLQKVKAKMKKACNGLLLITGSLWMMDVKAACQLQTSDSKPAAPFIINGDMTMGASIAPYNADPGVELIEFVVTLEGGSTHKISCDKPGDFFREVRSSKSLTSLPNTTPYPVLTNKLYDIGYKGLALRSPQIDKTYLKYCSYSDTCFFNQPKDSFYVLLERVSLVKYGDTAVQPGIFRASSLPQFTVLAGQQDSMVPIAYITLTGTVTINKPTCTTPDVQVQMGKWDINDFKGPDKATEWRNASIRFTGCDTFYGAANARQLYADTGRFVDRNIARNEWKASLNPQNGIIDRKKGIINIQPGSLSATGVGIQLAHSDIYNDFFDFDQEWRARISEGDSFTIPLWGRYIQTEKRITPGVANGVVSLTVNYR
ncbi:TPA: type 1 fimbrial protein [Citrobacter sedlakii]|nr:type 1 fimbrial protein [Citrobacter sedlakii]